MPIDAATIEETLVAARRRLLEARGPDGHWTGHLSSSALSTATAICALMLADRSSGSDRSADLIRRGGAWLAQSQNSDGGWGDTPDSPSNLSTSTLCWAALGLCESLLADGGDCVRRAEVWLRERVGDLKPAQFAGALDAVYGSDRTFSSPILTMCALAGRFGDDREAWRYVTQLPFELAALPRGWFRWLGLPVVSYALPALIAIGQARHAHRSTRNPIAWLLRTFSRGRTLGVLREIQPESGGFLEAVPLTSFVLMSLASIGEAGHAAAVRCREFLTNAVCEDGSWPIDSNLATWVTTLSVNALAEGELTQHISIEDRALLADWLVQQQNRETHAYTMAPPGGWAWTDLSGGVPDADDTCGALLALRNLRSDDFSGGELQAVEAGVDWLLGLQNRDGGIPTFCRGWGRLPFDRSAPELTAHALRAWYAWRDRVRGHLGARMQRVASRAVTYLIRTQRSDGAWIPLWFGNQHAERQENPLYGTSRVLRTGELDWTETANAESWRQAVSRGVTWILASQNSDGGWGGDKGVASSIEETAWAIDALAGADDQRNAHIAEVIDRGVAWLVERTADGRQFKPAPVGLYFAKLWYHEQLYPLIFTVAALERVARCRFR